MKGFHLNNQALFVLSFLLTLCSCKDTKIAKDMEGTWKRSYVTSYEDGTKSYVDEQVTFTYDASDEENDGGTFVEICTGQEEVDEDEANTKYRWVSKIEGTWKIELGTLYQRYNLSTLEVEIGKDDIDMKIKDEAWLWNDWWNLLTAGLYAKQNVLENLKKETYKELFRSYQRQNAAYKQDLGFNDVQIHGNVMSYETSDMGRVKLYRVKERKERQPNRKDVTDIPMKQSEENTDNDTEKLSVENVEYLDNVVNQGTNTYVPSNMLDGDPATAWAVNLDNASFDSDKLYGPVFTLNCSKLSQIIIRNGYAKSQDAYKNNARALHIIFCDAEKVGDENEATSYLYDGMLEDTYDANQILEIASNASCNQNINKIQMIFPKDGIRYGAKWNDLCISEIEFYGYK
jgi:hypothetical protein